MSKNRSCVINCLADGYHLKVEVNGIDIGIKGGTKESKRLFGRTAPVAPQLPREFRNLACIQKGDNEIKVTFMKHEKGSESKLTVELKRESQIGTKNFAVRIEDSKNNSLEIVKTFWTA